MTANFAQVYISASNGTKQNLTPFWPGSADAKGGFNNFWMYPQPAGEGAWHTCQLKWDSFLGVPGAFTLRWPAVYVADSAS